MRQPPLSALALVILVKSSRNGASHGRCAQWGEKTHTQSSGKPSEANRYAVSSVGRSRSCSGALRSIWGLRRRLSGLRADIFAVLEKATLATDLTFGRWAQ